MSKYTRSGSVSLWASYAAGEVRWMTTIVESAWYWNSTADTSGGPDETAGGSIFERGGVRGVSTTAVSCDRDVGAPQPILCTSGPESASTARAAIAGFSHRGAR